MLASNDGKRSESNTILPTDWLAHTPPDVLAKSFAVPQDTFWSISTTSLWIFQGEEPGDLDTAKAQAGVAAGTEPVVSRLSRSEPAMRNSGGSIQIADSTNFPVSRTVAAALITVKPGGMREMHWHPNADEWQYCLSGQARMTVFNTGAKASTKDFRPDDVGVVRKNFGHYVENTGDDVLQFLEVLRSNKIEEVSLAGWPGHTPPEMVMRHLNLGADDVRRLAKSQHGIVPVRQGA